jgi:hypothetical protein
MRTEPLIGTEKRVSRQKCFWLDDQIGDTLATMLWRLQRVLSEGAVSSRFIKVLVRF